MRQTVKNELLARTTPGILLTSSTSAILNPGPNGTVTPVLGRLCAVPIYLHKAIAATSISARVTTGSSAGVLSCGLFVANDPASPQSFSRLINFGILDTSATGEGTLSGTWTLPAGFSWLAYVTAYSACTLESSDTVPRIPGFVPVESTAWAGEEFKSRYITGGDTYSAMPSSFTSYGLNQTVAPPRFTVKGTVIA